MLLGALFVIKTLAEINFFALTALTARCVRAPSWFIGHKLPHSAWASCVATIVTFDGLPLH
jgi:hypothetical protein